jgi:hypothetical protein
MKTADFRSFSPFRTWLPDCSLLLLMEIRMVPPEGEGTGQVADGVLAVAEVLEGDREFLEALTMRLDEISGRPKGRFVISYLPGQPGARTPPTIR